MFTASGGKNEETIKEGKEFGENDDLEGEGREKG